jgi:hypothetical protein
MRHRQGNRVGSLSRSSVAALAMLVAIAPAHARGEAPDWRRVDVATGRIADVPGLEQLARDFPDSASVRRRLINAYLEAGMTEAVLREAVELVRAGYVFTPATRELLLSLSPSGEQRTALAWQDVNATARVTSSPLATIPAAFALVESVWRDPATGDLFATTVVSRALIVSRDGEGWALVPLRDTGSLSGMAFDSASGLLWIASGVFEQTPEPETAFRGLIAIDPATGEERRRIAAPDTATPADIAIGPAGEVFASDPLSGAIYVALPGAPDLTVLVAPGTFRSPQGLAPLAEDGLIVVSDYAYGLAIVDTVGGQIRRITADSRLTVDGIDGLWRTGDRLVAVQNGSRPMHVVELQLAPDSATIQGVLYRETANPSWTEPVGGAITGAELVYVATGQWDRFGPGGSEDPLRPPQPTEIRVLPVGENSPLAR